MYHLYVVSLALLLSLFVWELPGLLDVIDCAVVYIYAIVVYPRTPVSVKDNYPPDKETGRTNKLRECHIGGWIAISAAGSHGQSSRKRSVFLGGTTCLTLLV